MTATVTGVTIHGDLLNIEVSFSDNTAELFSAQLTDTVDSVRDRIHERLREKNRRQARLENFQARLNGIVISTD